MGGIAVTVLAAFVLIATIASGIFNKSLNEQTRGNLYGDRSNSAKIALSGLGITKDALSTDGYWGDCDGTDGLCSEENQYGYYPINSESLEEPIKEYPINSGELTVLMKPKDSHHVKVISVGETNGRKTYFASLFQKIEAYDKVPLVYGGTRSDFYGGKVCSYYWDGNEVAGVTNPNFSIYLDSGFYWSPEIVVPGNPAGPNPKDVKFSTNYSTEVKGYDIIDKMFSTGDVSLTNGAHVGYVYANGEVTVDRWSSYDNAVEHGNYEFPPFKKELEDNDVDVYGTSVIYCMHGELDLPPGTYSAIYLMVGCKLRLTGSEYKVRRLAATSFSTVEFTDPNTVLEARYVNVNTGASIVYESSEGRDNFIHVKAHRINLSGTYWWKLGGKIICKDPMTCLIDTDDFVAESGTITQGVVIARNRTRLYGAKVIGNLYTEDLYSTSSTVCNVVDKTGRQLLPESYFDIVDPKGEALPASIEEVKRVVCKNERDCDEKLDE